MWRKAWTKLDSYFQTELKYLAVFRFHGFLNFFKWGRGVCKLQFVVLGSFLKGTGRVETN